VAIEDPWQHFVGHIGGHAGMPSRWLVLTARSAPADVHAAEQAFGRLLPVAARVVLERWAEQGARVLLETVPRVLNPDLTAAELDPTDSSTAALFPAFCDVLGRTRDVAIALDVARGRDVVVAGAFDNPPPPGHALLYSLDGLDRWAYHLPGSLAELERRTSARGVRLSPQMRQLYLRTWGAPDDWMRPYFHRPERLVTGALYSELYREIADRVPLTPAVVDRQRAFVTLYDTIQGDSIGFFADERRRDGEYTIYLWDSGAGFGPWAPDFAGAVARFVADDW
jgi:hypothetical protein